MSSLASLASPTKISSPEQSRHSEVASLPLTIAEVFTALSISSIFNKYSLLEAVALIWTSHNAELTISELGNIANRLRTLQNDDIAVVTVPTKSRREEDGTVIIDFDPEAASALKKTLASNDLADFFRYLVSLGY